MFIYYNSSQDCVFYEPTETPIETITKSIFEIEKKFILEHPFYSQRPLRIQFRKEIEEIRDTVRIGKDLDKLFHLTKIFELKWKIVIPFLC